ncbi:MAG: nicotinamide-nucleotide adenylyltransferase [Thaumarchaeota archaeon]|nr:nicotinamide-nucleotide adenylyltransferase [Candidatus Terraquivivens yellowstonensis]MCL7392942.1 nicotinamide-nucleotide adenylyltransferase [Candidatus Terraquivivens yellowstonensis]MCL7398525.1 nicotinamide-nucleotide adenylyltransferase [Candidatus Terraquivivens yellowstonensis]MCL7399521.1 nicotinamide-nucleotide adenylyltransferase [Candidatus Terraquivivens yellowstonensis]MCL7400833.1 nicotinamide-nucleotide adenylyltransferase [Candidatus Terraquivivens yellowstonensis]
MRRALFIGRFQPIHMGHVEAIKHILSENDELIIVVGSAQYSHTFDNPFTAGERIEMVRMALEEAGIDLRKVLIIPVPDVGSHSMWVAHVKSLTPSFQTVYTNNPLVTQLFMEAGYEVKPIEMFRRNELIATRIRKMMVEDEDWRALVPKSVAQFIDKIDGVKRIKTIVSTDSPLHA